MEEKTRLRLCLQVQESGTVNGFNYSFAKLLAVRARQILSALREEGFQDKNLYDRLGACSGTEESLVLRHLKEQIVPNAQIAYDCEQSLEGFGEFVVTVEAFLRNFEK
ncbi:MAG: hypothetical protein WCO84_00415 [bacterium]